MTQHHNYRMGVSALLTFLAGSTPRTVPAQSQASDWAPLFQTLAKAEALAELEPESLCVRFMGGSRFTCRGLVFARRAELGGVAAEAVQARDALERGVVEVPRSAVAWYGLGIARLQAARLGVLARSGALLPDGISNETGAASAFIKALDLDSTFVLAGNALALVPVAREGVKRLPERIAVLERVEATLPPPAWYGMALVEREAGRNQQAIELLDKVLQSHSVPMGVARLELARALYAAHRPIEGHDALIAGAGDTSQLSAKAYRQELSRVASPAELSQWDSVSASNRPDWLDAFWAERDVRDGLPPGGRLIEHYRRVEYVFANFRLSLPQTGRQTAAGVSGTIDYFADDVMRDYMRHNPVIPGADAYNAMASTMNGMTGEAGNLGDQSPFSAFRSTQELIDDRGTVYLRQGAPDRQARTTGGEAMEVWLYDRAPIPLVLEFKEIDFDGQVGASRLVPTLLTANPLLRNQLCHLKTTLCSTAADPRNPTLIGSVAGVSKQGAMTRMDSIAMATGVISTSSGQNYVEAQRLSSGTLLERERREGLEAIAQATSSDAAAPPVGQRLRTSAELFGLDGANGGTPRLLAAFAILGTDLASTTSAARPGALVFPVRLRVMAANRVTGARFDLDTTRYFLSQRPLAEGQYLTGLIELPLPPGRYSASLAIGEDNGPRALAHLDDVRIPGTGTRLDASDLVLGREGSGVRWNSGATAVPLNPLNAYPKGGTAEVYFQLAGLKVGTAYQTVFEFYRSDDDAKHAPRMRIATTQAMHETRLEVQRTLGLKNLDPGRYRVVLSISGGGENVRSVGWLTIVK